MSPRKGKTDLSFGSRTDIGCVRENNEDSLLVAPPLYVVCDGMGGHAAGEIASEIAINTIAQYAPKVPDATQLGKAVEEANRAVLAAAQDGTERTGMGTTCTAAMVENERLIIAQVGDSRAYLLHQGTLQQLTRDHSLVADMVEAGRLTPEEARVHPQRSMITRALGSDPDTKPDLYEINVEAGDRLLLCSDGLPSMVKDSEIEDILCHTEDPQLAASKLVNEAINNGGRDNVTAIVVNIAGFAEIYHKRSSRRTRITATIIIVVLVAVIAGTGFGVNYWIEHSAFLGEQDGKVAIYQGVPDSFANMNFSNLVEVTDVNIDDLQPGVANRIKNKEIRVDSLEAAQELVDSYREEIADNSHTDESNTTTDTNGTASSSEADEAANTAADVAGQSESSEVGA